ncbi:MAG: RNA polymerase-binding protein DksA [Gammaproteobacteria bacterium]|nr:MAG: RNA polymerase-binding protein DksA [Gammaproteobacteria bacterium]
MPKKSTKDTKAKKTQTKKPAAKKTAVKKTTVKKNTKSKAAPKRNTRKTTKVNSKYKDEETFLASIEPYKLSKKEKYMSAKQKKHFSNILQLWKKMLQMEQDKTVNEIQSGGNHYADEADRATHEEVFSLEIRTRERERKLLAKIEKSIEDLTNSDYGFCSNPFCGVEIGIRRLEARPTASLCIDCKTLEEISEKQKFGG